MTRTRTIRSQGWSSRYYDYEGKGYDNSSSTGLTSRAVDAGPGYHKDKPLEILHTDRSKAPTVSGTRKGRYTFQKVTCERFMVWNGLGPSSRPSSVPPDGVLATSIAARANPGAPIVDLPLFMFELRDIPKLYKQAGDIFHYRNGQRRWGRGRDIGQINLMLQFGIFPILRDLVSLAAFSASVNTRVEQLERIGRGQPLKTGLGTYTASVTNNKTVVSTVPNGYSLEGRPHRETVSKLWGYAYWRSLPEFKRSPSDLQYAAKMSALGLQAHVSTVWEALPWSWMIDWFSSFGDFLRIHRANEWGYALNGVYLCETREDTHTIKDPVFERIVTSNPVDGNDMSLSDGTITTTQKFRTPVYPTPIAANLPFLTWDQVGIVGSLIATRRR